MTKIIKSVKIGSVTVYHGCAIELAKILENQADVIFTDPPYLLTGGGNGSGTGLRGKLAGEYDNKGEIVPCDISWNKIIRLIYTISKDQSKQFIMNNDKATLDLLTEGNKIGFRYHGSWVWLKNTQVWTKFGMKDHEHIQCFFKGKALQFENTGIKRTLKYNVPKSKDAKHPTPKPPEMIYNLLKAVGVQGKTVIDPFAGTGSTGIACQQLGVDCILIEKDEKYFNLCVDNIKKNHGKLY